MSDAADGRNQQESAEPRRGAFAVSSSIDRFIFRWVQKCEVSGITAVQVMLNFSSK